MSPNGEFCFRVDKADEGMRLDAAIAERHADISRSYVANLIKADRIRVDGQKKKPGYRIKVGEVIQGYFPQPEPIDFKAEAIAIDILFEDDHLIVINKAPGVVVHPAPGHCSGTLLNALLFHCPDLGGIGGKLRPGIVHRLDKDTSGVLVAAKTALAHERLSRLFKSRKIQKQYLTLVFGEFDSDSGTIDLPIGRHPVDRKRMSTMAYKGRAAETRWHICERFKGLTLLDVYLKTGRTHQIRVHCAAMNHPVVGDPVYGSRKLLGTYIARHFAESSPDIADYIRSVKRQMLHAWRLGFTHPQTGENVLFEAPLPADMAGLLKSLRRMT